MMRVRYQRVKEEVKVLENEKRTVAGGMVGKHGKPCVQVAPIDRHRGMQARSAYVAAQRGLSPCLPESCATVC